MANVNRGHNQSIREEFMRRDVIPEFLPFSPRRSLQTRQAYTTTSIRKWSPLKSLSMSLATRMFAFYCNGVVISS